MRSIPCAKLLVSFGTYLLLCTPRGAEALPSCQVADIRVQEGNTGTTTARFTVTRSDTSSAYSFSYYTYDSTAGATAGASCGGNVDYISARGTLPFSRGQRSATIDIQICGDSTPEKDENVVLLVGKTMAKCTILNDDSPNVSIDDNRGVEGNSQGTHMSFHISISASPAQTVTVWYDVKSVSEPQGIVDNATGGTSCGGSADYVGVTGRSVQFSPGDTSTKSVYVQLCGDTTPEPDETFHVVMTRVEGAIIRDGMGLGTLVNDDLPILSVTDFTVSEPPNDMSLAAAYCTIKLNSTAHNGCSVDYTIVSGTATVGSTSCDVSSTGGSETFPAGDDEETITLGICGDTLREGNETFEIRFSNPRGLSVPDTVVVGTITDND